MSALLSHDPTPSQLDRSRQAAARYAELSALAQAHPRRHRSEAQVRRFRRAVARYLVTTARLVDVR